LIAECAEAGLDEIAARETAHRRGVDGLTGAPDGAREIQADARRAFETVGGGDRAANAAADRQAALSELRDVAEQYVNVRSSVTAAPRDLMSEKR
jgi:hypothetical protein